MGLAPSVTVVMAAADTTGWHDVLAGVRRLERAPTPPDQVVVVVDHDDDLLERAADHLAERPSGMIIDVIANLGAPGADGVRESARGWTVGEVVVYPETESPPARATGSLVPCLPVIRRP